MTEHILPIAEAGQPEPEAPRATRQPLRLYPHESALFVIMAIISGLTWLSLTLATVGMIWIIMLALYLVGLFGFSYFITYVRGNGVRVTAEQFPDLYQRFVACTVEVGLKKLPEFYLITGNGALNAFATRFLHRYYVVLLTDIVDALDDDPEALNFYIGHELGHIAQKHIVHHWWLVFARWIPLLGAAYSRAREYSCDQYGLRCCHNQQSAIHALSVLAAGSRRWKSMNKQAYIDQAQQTGGFWMSLNELTGDYPWLCKRVARVQEGDFAKFPRRSIFAWLISATIPNTGFGILGAMIIYMYMLLILIPIGLAGYTSYQKKGESAQAKVELSQAYNEVHAAAKKVNDYYVAEGNVDGVTTLADVGYTGKASALIERIEYVQDDASLVAYLKAPLAQSEIMLTPELDEKTGELIWSCQVTGKFSAEAMPANCTSLDLGLDAPAAEKKSPFDDLFSLLAK